jgi:hypothetical protein
MTRQAQKTGPGAMTLVAIERIVVAEQTQCEDR